MKKYRLTAKNIALTYPKCEWSKEEVLEELEWKLGSNLEGYIISKEKHEDGSNHIHAYIKLGKMINMKNEHFLDIKETHGNYQSVKSKGGWIKYILKNGDYITNMDIKNETTISFYDKLMGLVRENKLEEALKELENSTNNKELIMNFGKFRKNLIEFDNKINPIITQSKYNKEDYVYPQELLDWKDNKENKALVLEGESGTGKTQGMLALLKDLNPKLIRELNDIKDITPAHKAAIYDDIDLSTINPDQVKHLFDGEIGGTVRVLYGTVKLKADLKKVLITNEFKLKDMKDEHLKAILRRITHVKLKDPLIKSITYKEREIEREIEVKF